MPLVKKVTDMYAATVQHFAVVNGTITINSLEVTPYISSSEAEAEKVACDFQPIIPEGSCQRPASQLALVFADLDLIVPAEYQAAL